MNWTTWISSLSPRLARKLFSCSSPTNEYKASGPTRCLRPRDIFNWNLLVEKRVSPEDPPSDRHHPHNDGDHEHDVVHHVATKLAETASHVIAASLTRDYEWLNQFLIKYRPPGCSWCTLSTWRWLSEGGGADRCRCHQESASRGCLALLGSRGWGRQVQQPGRSEDQDMFHENIIPIILTIWSINISWPSRIDKKKKDGKIPCMICIHVFAYYICKIAMRALIGQVKEIALHNLAVGYTL